MAVIIRRLLRKIPYDRPTVQTKSANLLSTVVQGWLLAVSRLVNVFQKELHLQQAVTNRTIEYA